MSVPKAPYEFKTQDIEYLRIGSDSLLARIYTPQGPGPFPAVIELHGGGWSRFDRTRGKSVHEALARSGVVVAAIDFRQGAAHPYPAALNDINFAIRWLKSNAARFNVMADHIGLSGNSTGGHLAVLAAMRPEHEAYKTIALSDGNAVDASVRFVVALWPVINPIARYRHAVRRSQFPDPPDWARELPALHDAYWLSEDNMIEGNPMLILERGETVSLPPIHWVQPADDPVHNYQDADSDFGGRESERFASNYRRAGGTIEIDYFDAPMMFATLHPTLPESIAALSGIVSFVHRVCGQLLAPSAEEMQR